MLNDLLAAHKAKAEAMRSMAEKGADPDGAHPLVQWGVVSHDYDAAFNSRTVLALIAVAEAAEALTFFTVGAGYRIAQAEKVRAEAIEAALDNLTRVLGGEQE